MPLKLTHEQVVAFGAFVCLVVSVGVYWFVFTRISAQESTLIESRAELAQVIAEDEARDALMTFVTQTGPDRDELKRYLLSRYNPTQFLSAVETLGSDTNVAVSVETITEESSAVTDAGAGGGVQYLQVVLTIEGRWDNLYRLLRLFERMPYVVEMNQVTLEESKEKGGSGTGAWEGRVHMRVAVQ